MTSPPLAPLLFGGTFDPFHNGHLQLAQVACRHHGLDRVRLLPSPAARAGTWHRIEMLMKLTREHPFLELDLSQILIDSQSTHETLTWMRENLHINEPVFVTGGDQFMRLHSWHRSAELLPAARWLVSARDEHQPGSDEWTSQCRRLTSLGTRFDVLNAPIQSVSSTHVRQLCAARQDITDLVPASVAGYVAAQSLYRD